MPSTARFRDLLCWLIITYLFPILDYVSHYVETPTVIHAVQQGNSLPHNARARGQPGRMVKLPDAVC